MQDCYKEPALMVELQYDERQDMSVFDKLCAVAAVLLGVVFLLLGVIGLFLGCSANFTLPPILGALPAFVGWGIIRAVYVAWNVPRKHGPDSPMISEQ